MPPSPRQTPSSLRQSSGGKGGSTDKESAEKVKRVRRIMAEVAVMTTDLKATPVKAEFTPSDIFRLALFQAKTDLLKAKKDRLSSFRDIRQHMVICAAADAFLLTIAQGDTLRTLVNQKWNDLVTWSRQAEEIIQAGMERLSSVPGYFVGMKMPARDEIQKMLGEVPELRRRMAEENSRLMTLVPEGILDQDGALDKNFESYLLFTERSSSVAVPRVTELLRSIRAEAASNPIMSTVDRYETSLRGLLQKHEAQRSALETAALLHREGNYSKASAVVAPIGAKFPDLDYRVLEEIKTLESALQRLDRQDGAQLVASVEAISAAHPGLPEDSELAQKLARSRERGLSKQSRSRVIIAVLALAGVVTLALGSYAAIGLAEKSKREEDQRMARQAEENKRVRAAEAEAETRRALMAEESRKAELQTMSLKTGASAGAATDQETQDFLKKNQGATHTVMTRTSGPEMPLAWVPAGSFLMGSSAVDTDARLTSVTLSRGFWLGRTEVTQAQWSALMDNNPSEQTGPALPVEQVHWNEAMNFCRALTDLERKSGRLPKGLAYTLPTEAQWEYASRAGQEGDVPPNAAETVWSMDNSGGKTNPAGSLKANAWGLHDMFGNVAEWCLDWYGPYGSLNVSDPAGAAEGRRRVNRGGSWLGTPADFRYGRRDKDVPEIRSRTIGFRVALVVQ